MDGSVRYRLMAAHQLPYGPVSIILSKPGNLTVCVDRKQMDPILPPVISNWSSKLLTRLRLTFRDDRQTHPALRVRVHRDFGMGGTQLLAADIMLQRHRNQLDLFLPGELVTREVARQLGIQGTCMMYRFV